VVRGDVPAFFSGTAVLEAENEAEIIARTTGRVQTLHVEEGDRVRKDQLLLELDGREQEIVLQEARATAENLRHELNRLQAMFLFVRSDTIYGGTNQIQRNIIAERGLGMPKEPRLAVKTG